MCPDEVEELIPKKDAPPTSDLFVVVDSRAPFLSRGQSMEELANEGQDCRSAVG